jgi:TetR/AcrR family transcriptional repressor of nem operon
MGNMALERADHSAETREKLAGVAARWSALLVACLGEARKAGELADGIGPDDLAEMIVEAWEGAVMRGRILQRRDPYDRFMAVVLPRLLGSPTVLPH